MNKWSKLAIMSFIFGFLGWLVPILLGILLKTKKIEFTTTTVIQIHNIIPFLWLLAIFLGIFALRQIRSNPTQKGKVLVILGIILGGMAGLLTVVGTIVAFLINKT